jgi:hypothetical protein
MERQRTVCFAAEGDVKGALAGGEKAILEIVMATHSGMTDR